MAWMAGKPRYAEFVLDAAQRHTLSSLGVVGLACKSAATVGEALALHGKSRGDLWHGRRRPFIVFAWEQRSVASEVCGVHGK